jgi:hypothetical protein
MGILLDASGARDVFGRGGNPYFLSFRMLVDVENLELP